MISILAKTYNLDGINLKLEIIIAVNEIFGKS